MTLRTRLALLCAMLATATGCAALSAALGVATVAAPAVVSILDAYAATAKTIAPAASQPDLAALADLLRKRDECVVAASVATMPQSDAGETDGAAIAEALRASADASARLAAAVEAMAPRPRKKAKTMPDAGGGEAAGGT